MHEFRLIFTFVFIITDIIHMMKFSANVEEENANKLKNDYTPYNYLALVNHTSYKRYIVLSTNEKF